ncbi:hypothetical protein JHK82_053057 [Glycine max]|nr:hypothetical protein JHK86_052902 [Glycine max]KAG4927275.1 hypothetical protein JHK85_053761 [Glycine max]KAG5082894.1 hypothetical protein JHK84_052932 [Glycine max]KAG5085660.1 hypothetical protein JHK82_053057 [Glycine max]
MEAQLPPGWKSLNIDQYDGLLDPNKHVDASVLISLSLGSELEPQSCAHFNDYDTKTWSFLRQHMQEIVYNIRQVERKSYQIHLDGRNDQV